MDGQIQFEKGSSQSGLATLKLEGQQSGCVTSGPIRASMDRPNFRRPTR